MINDNNGAAWLGAGAQRSSTNGMELRAEVVCQRFNITPKALRYYEALGVIKPRRIGSVRVYCEADCDRIALIAKDRKLSGTLYEVGRLLDGGSSADAIALGREKCLAQITALEAARAEIGLALAELRRIDTMLTVRMAIRKDAAAR
jgi:DNA-binding transcriptional MerR regulator